VIVFLIFTLLHSKFVLVLASFIGTPVTALDISKRLILCHDFHVPNYSDGPLLIGMQQANGTWEPADLYRLPTTKGRVYNPAVDMCFCLKALELVYLKSSS